MDYSSEDLEYDEPFQIDCGDDMAKALTERSSKWKNFENKYSETKDCKVELIPDEIVDYTRLTLDEGENEEENLQLSVPYCNEKRVPVEPHYLLPTSSQSKSGISFKSSTAESRGKFETFETWLQSSGRPSLSFFAKLDEYIKYYLRIHIDYIYIKLWSSRIKRDKEQRFWRRMYVEKMKFLRKYLQDDHILFYLRRHLERNDVDRKTLTHRIEKIYKSKLRKLFEVREKKLKSEEECRVLIEQEWDLLVQNISEYSICVYHDLLYGRTPLITKGKKP